MADQSQGFDLNQINQTMLTRRRALKLSLGLAGTAAAMSLLAACGDDDDGDDGDAPAVEPDDDEDEDEPTPEDDTEDETEDDEEEEPTDEPDEDEDEEADAPEGDQHGGELTYALSADPPNLDPHIHTGTAARAVKLQIYNTLARYEEDGSLGPSLATEWEISDDGLDYSFQLRDDVNFHSGDQFTSDDVVATLERIQDEAVGAHRQAEMSAITEIDSSDEYAIAFTLEAPNAPIMEYFAQPETSIFSRGFIDSGDDPNQTMMGTGPFTFVEHEPGVRLIVERNPDYFLDPLPYLDRIVFVPYPDENTRMAAVQGGDADMADYVPWRDMEAIDDSPDLELIASEQSAFMCVMYNHRVEPFDDPAVRYALNFAFDYQAIADAAFFGRAAAITGGLIPEGHWAHHDGLEGAHEFDPERAQELLAEAGYPDGFPCTLMSTSQYGMHQNTAEIVQNNLQAIGVDCELELFDWATVVDRHAQSDYEFRIQGTSADVNDPDFLTRFFGSGGSDARSYGFADDDIDALLEEGRSLVEEEDRREVYNQIEERLEELAVMTYLVYRQDAEVVWNYVHGYHRLPGPLGFLSGIYLQDIWLDQ